MYPHNSIFSFVGPKTQEVGLLGGGQAFQCSVNDKYQILKHPFGHPAVASDVTKSLSWIKTVREKVEKTDATTTTPTQTSTSTTQTQTSAPGQTDPTDEGTTVETDENTTVEGGKTQKLVTTKFQALLKSQQSRQVRGMEVKSLPLFLQSGCYLPPT